MTSPLDNALNRALQTRLALQISLSSLPTVEEWMDIHLDRWLEHVPMPPEMPAGHVASYLCGIGTDLQRVWWGSWGDPRGFVPKMADYFKLCNMAKSDEAILDQIGLTFEPQLVGSWVAVWGGKVVTGWHFWDPHEFARLEPLFGTHEAKFALKKWATEHNVERFQRFMQSIGETPFSEIELNVPGDSAAEMVDVASKGFAHFLGEGLAPGIEKVLATSSVATTALNVRIAGGKVTKLGLVVEGITLDAVRDLCAAASLGFDEKLERIINTLSAEGIARVEYVRAGEHHGVDLFVEPTEPAKKPQPGEKVEESVAN
jgi:hypothetical protein